MLYAHTEHLIFHYSLLCLAEPSVWLWALFPPICKPCKVVELQQFQS